MAEENEAVHVYLPDKEDWHQLPRKFLGDILNTVLEEKFGTWMLERVK